MFIFPDGVFVTRLQGFLGWYGWLNLFVSLPFLWDGDFKHGLYPFVLGAIPLLISIYLVFKDNDNRKVVFKRSARVYLNSDVKLIEPGDDTYSFYIITEAECVRLVQSISSKRSLLVKSLIRL